MTSAIPLRALILVLLVSNFMLSACVTTNPASAPSTVKEAPTAGSPRIRVGMTRQQVIAAWGEPSGRQVTSSGEIWTWGGQRWKRMIPYAGPFVNVQTSKVVFGSNGRVKDFRLTDRGDAMTDIEGVSPGHFGW